jgi:hypothetical protein
MTSKTSHNPESCFVVVAYGMTPGKSNSVVVSEVDYKVVVVLQIMSNREFASEKLIY